MKRSKQAHVVMEDGSFCKMLLVQCEGDWVVGRDVSMYDQNGTLISIAEEVSIPRERVVCVIVGASDEVG